jgi:hypothetical protein
MKKNDLQISIPTPCHEDWDAMAPTEIGKFCSSCQKEVIDFSVMSDQEIRRILNSSKETPCGRFNINQIERPLVAEVPVNRSLTWLKYAASLLLIFQGSNAISQTTNTTISPKADVKTDKNSIKMMEISGVLLDSITKDAIFDAKVLIKLKEETINIRKTDFRGEFKLNLTLTDSIENYTIRVSKKLDGYQEQEISLIDFLKTNVILLKTEILSTSNAVQKDQSITVTKCYKGLITKVEPTKTEIPQKKWYQFWKK